MVDYLHRFVPPATQFIQPVKMVIQLGHSSPIVAVSFSKKGDYVASLDADALLKIWCVETVEVLGSYYLPFACDTLRWDGWKVVASLSSDAEQEFEVLLDDEENTENTQPNSTEIASNLITMLDDLRVSQTNDGIQVEQYGNTWLFPCTNIIDLVVDPLERYVVFCDETSVHVLNIHEKIESYSQKLENGNNAFLRVSPRGHEVLLLQTEGAIWLLDPMREKLTRLAHCCATLSCCDVNGWGLCAIGDQDGKISVFDLEKRTRLFKTPKKQNDFIAYLPLAEKPGIAAFRSESFSAYFSETHEIEPSSPLTAHFSSASPSKTKNEILVALTNGDVFRLELLAMTTEKLCELPSHALQIAAANNEFLAWCEDQKLRLFNGDSLQVLESCSTTPDIMTLSEDANFAATYIKGKLCLYAQSTRIRELEFPNVKQMIYGRSKLASTLFLLTATQELYKCDPNTYEISLVRSFASHYTAQARILGISICEKNSAFVLFEADHNQKVIVRVNLSTGKSVFVLRVFGAGAQLWGAMDTDLNLYLRNDADCIRFVKDRNAFEVNQWMNSEPLAIQ